MVYKLKFSDKTFSIGDDQYQKGSASRISYNMPKPDHVFIWVNGASVSGHYTEFVSADDLGFNSLDDLMYYIETNFFYNVEVPPAPVTPTLQSVTGAGSTTPNGMIIDRASNSTKRMVYRDRSSRTGGLSALTMSTIMHPTAVAIFQTVVTGCAILKIGTLANEQNANMYFEGRFLDPYHPPKEWWINGYFRKTIDSIFVCDDIRFFYNKPVRWMNDAAGYLYLVIGTNDTVWDNPRFQVKEVMARFPEDQTIFEAYYGSDAGLMLYAPVQKQYGQSAGLYVPVFDNLINVSNIQSYSGFYMQTGNIVSVQLDMEVTVIDPGTEVGYTLSLPLPSAFTSANNAAGIVMGNGIYESRLQSVPDMPGVPGRIEVVLKNENPGAHLVQIAYKYQIL